MKKNLSNHYKNSRAKRENEINKYMNGSGHIVDGFVIDKKHKDGLEVHSITDTGLILVHNMKSGKLVTKLVARPEQIKRYYDMSGRETPPEYEHILYIAEWHKSLGYNK